MEDKAKKEAEELVELLNIKVSNLLMVKTNIPVEDLVDIVIEIDKLYKDVINPQAEKIEELEKYLKITYKAWNKSETMEWKLCNHIRGLLNNI